MHHGGSGCDKFSSSGDRTRHGAFTWKREKQPLDTSVHCATSPRTPVLLSQRNGPLKNMRQLIRFVGSGLALVLLSGCIDMEEDYTVNPDGSGKVVRVATMDLNGGLGALAGLGGPAAKQPSAKEKEEMKKGVVAGMLQNSPGIEAWKDVTAETLPDGRIKFKGTGYFKSISAVGGAAGGMAGGGQGGGSGFTLTKGPNDTLVLEMKDPEGALPTGGKKSDGAKKTGKEIDAQIKKERDEFAAGKALMGGMFAKLKIKQSFHLPGIVTEANNLKNEAGAVSLSIEGPKLIQALDTMMADDKFMRLQVQAESDPAAKEQATAMSMEKMFGQKGPVRAVASGPFTAQFDYEAEAGEARKSYAALLKQYAGGSVIGRPDARPARPAYTTTTVPDKPAAAVVSDSLEGTENQFLPRP